MASSSQMPGIEPEESASIRLTLETVAKLELREVSPRNSERGADGKSLAQRVLDGDEIVPGYRAYELTQEDEDGNEFTNPILLNRRIALGGSDIVFATPSPSRSDSVDITLNGEGTDKMIALTVNMRPNVGRIAIVLDGVVLSAPVVQSVPLGKNFVINGLDEPGETKELANALMNPLENPLVVEQERTVSPTLGSAFVKQGIFSGLAGLTITALFIFIYYRTAGPRRPRRFGRQLDHPVRRDGDVRIHLLPPRHRRTHPHHRHGSGCERAHLRTAP